MRVLVACEYSGRVRDAFLARGHDAISCDLERSERTGPHYRGSVLDIIDQTWDMLIAFPPCTNLALVGNAQREQKRMDGREFDSANFFMQMVLAHHIPRIAVENPKGVMSRQYRKPDQIVQPWMFGHPYTKATCLWLKGIPLLLPTNSVKPQGGWVSSGKTGYGLHHDPKERSRTFQGVADAMAEQWGTPCPE